MKKLIAIFLILSAVAVCFTGCMRGKDRAENNGIVTDDTTNRTDRTDRNNGADSTSNRNNGNNTTDRNTGNTNGTDTKGGGILDDAGDAVSDAVRGATDAVDEILGGTKDTAN